MSNKKRAAVTSFFFYHSALLPVPCTMPSVRSLVIGPLKRKLTGRTSALQTTSVSFEVGPVLDMPPFLPDCLPLRPTCAPGRQEWKVVARAGQPEADQLLGAGWHRKSARRAPRVKQKGWPCRLPRCLQIIVWPTKSLSPGTKCSVKNRVNQSVRP